MTLPRTHFSYGTPSFLVAIAMTILNGTERSGERIDGDAAPPTRLRQVGCDFIAEV